MAGCDQFNAGLLRCKVQLVVGVLSSLLGAESQQVLISQPVFQVPENGLEIDGRLQSLEIGRAAGFYRQERKARLARLPQQQPARVTGDRSPLQPPHHLTLIQGMQFEGFFGYTLSTSGCRFSLAQVLLIKDTYARSNSLFQLFREIAGLEPQRDPALPGVVPCAEQDRQLEGESPFDNVREVKS